MVIAAVAHRAGYFPRRTRNCIKAGHSDPRWLAKSIDRGNKLSEKIRFEMECVIEKKKKDRDEEIAPSESVD